MCRHNSFQFSSDGADVDVSARNRLRHYFRAQAERESSINCKSPSPAIVTSELRLILHRLERPRLWSRCEAGNIHVSRCPNGHQGNIRASLLLFDPGLEFAIFSPALLTSEAQARSEGELLVERIRFYDRERFPHRWAAVHSELALSFRHRRQGNPRDNLREAVRCSDAALQVFQIDIYPEDYAIAQSNRASALLDSEWDRPRSMQLGIEAYREALRVYNRESYPDDWALVHKTSTMPPTLSEKP
jgi:hypothetical protein